MLALIAPILADCQVAETRLKVLDATRFTTSGRLAPEPEAESRRAPAVREDHADRLGAARLADLLVKVGLADWEAAGRTCRFAKQPVAAGDDDGLDH